MKRRDAFLILVSFALVLLGFLGCSPPEEADEDATPPLLALAERGDLAGLDRLVREDAKPDVRDSCDWTPLMKAALNGHVEAAERLLAAGAEVDAEDKGATRP